LRRTGQHEAPGYVHRIIGDLDIHQPRFAQDASLSAASSPGFAADALI
jgi:hypothetical protein